MDYVSRIRITVSGYGSRILCGMSDINVASTRSSNRVFPPLTFRTLWKYHFNRSCKPRVNLPIT